MSSEIIGNAVHRYSRKSIIFARRHYHSIDRMVIAHPYGENPWGLRHERQQQRPEQTGVPRVTEGTVNAFHSEFFSRARSAGVSRHEQVSEISINGRSAVISAKGYWQNKREIKKNATLLLQRLRVSREGDASVLGRVSRKRPG